MSNNKLPGEHEHSLDPRAFLPGISRLWVNNSNNPKAPLLSGKILVPVRFIDFLKDYSTLPIVGGEEHYEFCVSLWENNRKVKYGRPPQYTGNTAPYTPNLGAVREDYEKAIAIIKPANRTIR